MHWRKRTNESWADTAEQTGAEACEVQVGIPLADLQHSAYQTLVALVVTNELQDNDEQLSCSYMIPQQNAKPHIENADRSN